MKADAYFDKILLAEKDIKVYKGHPESSDFYVVQKGDEVGRIYSYVQKDGDLYWQLYTDDGGNDLFVKHAENKLDIRKNGIGFKSILDGFAKVTGLDEVAKTVPSIFKYALIAFLALIGLKIFFEFD